MINYVWLALLVIGITFATYREINDDPVTISPGPELLEGFSAESASFPGAIRASTGFAESGSKGAEASALVTYDLTASNRAEIPANVAIPGSVSRTEKDGSSNSFKAASLSMQVRGDGAGQIVRANFSDKEGKNFVAEASTRLSAKDEWQKVTFDLTALSPAPDSVGATPAAPLTLDSITLVRPKAAQATRGTIQFDEIALALQPKSMVKKDLESNKNWPSIVTASSAWWANKAITLAIELIGNMMLWLGLMRIAEKAGLVQILARALKPIMARLFPEIPPEGEAMGAIIMNISANMLGLGNAATPMGLKAMEELQKLNANKEYASNSMCMLLALNTTSITFVVPSIYAYRAAAGSKDIMIFWPYMLAACFTASTTAVICAKICERLAVFRVPPATESTQENAK